jgi:hypothetical protein
MRRRRYCPRHNGPKNGQQQKDACHLTPRFGRSNAMSAYPAPRSGKITAWRAKSTTPRCDEITTPRGYCVGQTLSLCEVVDGQPKLVYRFVTSSLRNALPPLYRYYAPTLSTRGTGVRIADAVPPTPVARSRRPPVRLSSKTLRDRGHPGTAAQCRYCCKGLLQQNLPGPDSCSANKPVPSFDHIVSRGEQRRWHGEAECLGGVEIDDKVEFRWL